MSHYVVFQLRITHGQASLAMRRLMNEVFACAFLTLLGRAWDYSPGYQTRQCFGGFVSVQRWHSAVQRNDIATSVSGRRSVRVVRIRVRGRARAEQEQGLT